MLVGLRRRRLEAYLFATTLKHLNRDDCVPPNEEFGRGKQPVDLLRTNGSRAELLNRVGPEPEPYTGLPDHSSLYGPPTGIISWRGADYEPRAVIVKPDGNLPGILVHRCVSGKVLGKAIDAAEAAKLSGNASATWLFQHITGSPRDCFARRLGGVRLRSRPEKKPRKTRSAQPQLPGMPPPLPPGTTRVLPMQLQISDRMTDSTGEWEVVGGRRAVRQHGLVQSVRGLDEGERQQMRAGHEPAERAGDIASRRHTPILNRTSHQFAVHRGQRFSAAARGSDEAAGLRGPGRAAGAARWPGLPDPEHPHDVRERRREVRVAERHLQVGVPE